MASPPYSYDHLNYKEIKISNFPASAEKVTPIVFLTLYRPRYRNAYTEKMRAEIVDAFERFDLDDRIKCIILTGFGSTFCAGADLRSELLVTEEKPNEHRDGGGQISLAIHRCRRPTIAAINGDAIGVGITMTMACTVRLASSTAKVGFVFGKRGLTMEGCSSFFLPRLIGFSRAIHLASLGSVQPADSRLLEGLFSEVVPSEKLMSRALLLATEFVETTSIVSSYLMRQLMYRNEGSPEGAHLLESRIFYEILASKDKAEGVASFLEKRPAKFTGTLDDSGVLTYPWWNLMDTRYRAKSQIPKETSKL